MTVYTAATLDLSLLPDFALTNPDFETIRAARVADLTARLQAAGVDYDVGSLESDPLAILEQTDAYRELLAFQAMNDAAMSMTLAKAAGPALDAIAATYYADLGLRRLAGEADDAFRERIALAPEAKSPGTLGGYEFWARSASVGIVSARALNYASGLVKPGQILVVVAGAQGADLAPLISAAQGVILDPDTKAASDDVRVIGATSVAYSVTATLRMKTGPDSSLVQAAAQTALQAYAASRRKVSEVIYASGVTAALKVSAVDDVTGAFSDIDPGPTGIADLGAVNVNVEIING